MGSEGRGGRGVVREKGNISRGSQINTRDFPLKENTEKIPPGKYTKRDGLYG